MAPAAQLRAKSLDRNICLDLLYHRRGTRISRIQRGYVAFGGADKGLAGSFLARERHRRHYMRHVLAFGRRTLATFVLFGLFDVMTF